MSRYERKITRDLPRWRSLGWVTSEGEIAILSDVRAKGWGLDLAHALAILGAVLLAFAAMSFVAANWQDMPRLVRMGVLFAALWASYALAGNLFNRGLNGFAHAVVLLGAALFGASIMLIAQMYHIGGNPPDAVLTWALGTLLAGVLLRSDPALALAMLLVGLWSGWETVLTSAAHWPFLPEWGVVMAAFIWRRWRPGYVLGAVVLWAWIVRLGYVLYAQGSAHGVVLAIGLLIVACVLAVQFLAPAWREDTAIALGLGLAVAFAAVIAFQFVDERTTAGLVAFAILALALTLGAVAWGWLNGESSTLWLGYVGFSIEILSLYFKTIGTLLGSSLFFLAMGVIVLGLAAMAYWLYRERPHGAGVPA